MKQGKRPTRQQKIMLAGAHLLPANWRVVNDSKESFTVIHKHTNTVRTIKKIV